MSKFDLNEYAFTLESIAKHIRDATEPGSKIVSYGPADEDDPTRPFITLSRIDSYEQFSIDYFFEETAAFLAWLKSLPRQPPPGSI